MPRNAHDKQLAEVGVEDQFRGTRELLQPRIVVEGFCSRARSTRVSLQLVRNRASPRMNHASFLISFQRPSSADVVEFLPLAADISPVPKIISTE
jgi:hypothetical protein